MYYYLITGVLRSNSPGTVRELFCLLRGINEELLTNKIGPRHDNGHLKPRARAEVRKGAPTRPTALPPGHPNGSSRSQTKKMTGQR